MAETGNDPWTRSDAMLKTKGNAAAYDVGVNADFRQTSGSSLARQEAFGEGWDTSGPDIPSLSYHPTIAVIGNGATAQGKVAP